MLPSHRLAELAQKHPATLRVSLGATSEASPPPAVAAAAGVVGSDSGRVGEDGR